MARKPQRLYRLWCGKKKHSAWLDSVEQAWQVAYEKKLAYHDDRSGGLGPLTWIEVGERDRAKAKTRRVDTIGINKGGLTLRG